MSAFLYGRLQRNQASDRYTSLGGDSSQLVEALVAALPAEVLLVHTLVLAATVKYDDDGKAVEITNPTGLGWSLAGLAGLALVLTLLGHLGKSDTGGFTFEAKAVDGVRVLLPSLAFVAWALLMPTSAATPLINHFGWSTSWALAFGAALGAVVLATARALSDRG